MIPMPHRSQNRAVQNVRSHFVLSILSSAVMGALSGGPSMSLGDDAATRPCRLFVFEEGTDWPVPLVELRTTHNVRFVSDNAGMIAFQLPELMHREVWLSVEGHGYGVAADGFGYRGVKVVPQPGETIRIPVKRDNIARRLGRLTGAGLFAESQHLGDDVKWADGPILGCDSVQLAEYRGRLSWAWGDTALANHPLGIFNTLGATTDKSPLSDAKPPLRLPYRYFSDDAQRPRGVAPLPGNGPTWLTAYLSLPTADGGERLCATYRKITPPLSTNEVGLCVWNDATESFAGQRVLWKVSDGGTEPARLPDGHPARWTDASGRNWILFGNPFPTLKCPATFEGWNDPATWESVSSPRQLRDRDDKTVVPHSGSIAYSAFRRRWIAVFTQKFGKPSAFGEIWYAEAESPLGPWGVATKVLTHANYTFYNPRIQHELIPADSPFLLFEGTYTREFADAAHPTPRYDYNQMLYRVDFDDPRLSPSQSKAAP